MTAPSEPAKVEGESERCPACEIWATHCRVTGHDPIPSPAPATERGEQEPAATLTPSTTGERAKVWIFGEYLVTATADVDDAFGCCDLLKDAAERWLERRTAPMRALLRVKDELIAEAIRQRDAAAKGDSNVVTTGNDLRQKFAELIDARIAAGRELAALRHDIEALVTQHDCNPGCDGIPEQIADRVKENR